ncbi:hypothetical protein FKW77_009324 [Venturia effusa]|uniref:Up-regulated during septation protein 1 domain-containing protein n=1 Tax=Venturia effusa TaxID=50376 RepID=A0A517L9Y4_9PEZI|nr:hypothetical protein FKW77_009324 [Venturia effusa]
MPNWSLLLLFLIPLITFLQPGFIAMATLSTITEETSGGHFEAADEDETQIVPETQFEDAYGDNLAIDDQEDDDRPAPDGRDSMTPGTKTMLEASRPMSSHGPVLAASDRTFVLERPKSSGEDSVTGGFSYAKHEVPKMNFRHGNRHESPSPEIREQQESREYREDKLQAVKVPIKPSHDDRKTQTVIMPIPHGYPRQTEEAAPVSGGDDRQPTKRLSRTKSGRKRSKETASVPRVVGPSNHPLESPAQLYDHNIRQNRTWRDDPQVRLHDAATQPINEQSWQQQHQQPIAIEPVDQDAYQQQIEAQLNEHAWQEQQKAMKPIEEPLWQQQDKTQRDDQHWQEQRGTNEAISDHSRQHTTKSQPHDEQHSTMTALDEQAWQPQSQLQFVNEQEPFQSSMVGNLHEAGAAQEEVQLHNLATQRHRLDFHGNNGQATDENYTAGEIVNSAPGHPNPLVHGNSVQLMPIATGIKGVTKKKGKKVKKKKRNPNSRPALDVSTLPETIFDIPFEQLGRFSAVRPGLHQDQQQGPVPQSTGAHLAKNKSLHVPSVGVEKSGQHDLGPTVEVMEDIAIVEQESQTQRNEHAHLRAVDNELVTAQGASYSAPRQTSDRSPSHLPDPLQEEPEQQVLPHCAASSGHSTGRDLLVHPDRQHHGAAADSYHVHLTPQNLGPQHLQAKIVTVKDQTLQNTCKPEAQDYQDTCSESHRDSQLRGLRHEQLEEPSHVKDPIAQDLDPYQHHFGQDRQTLSHAHSSKYQALRETKPETLPHVDKHVSSTLQAKHNHDGLNADGKGNRPLTEAQHSTSFRRLPSGGCAPRVLVQSEVDDPLLVQLPEHQGQTNDNAESSHIIQQCPMSVNARPATRRRGIPAAASRTKSNSGKCSKEQFEIPVTDSTVPVIDMPTVTLATHGMNDIQPPPATEATSAQTDPVAGAIKVLQLTLQQNLHATVAKEDEAKRALQAEIAGLKISEARLQAEVNIVTASKAELLKTSRQDREKLKANSEKLTKLQKFISGINNDLVKEKQNAKILHLQITELMNEGQANATERTQVHEQLAKAIETSKAVQSKFAKSLTSAKSSLQKLEFEKAALEKELQEKNRLLEDERNQRMRLADDVRFQAIDQQLMKQLMHDISASLIEKLSELQMTITASKDVVTNQGVAELLHLVKALGCRNSISPDDISGLKEHIQIFQNSMINRINELQSASTSDSPEVARNAKAALDLEKTLSEQLSALKADVVSTQTLQTQLAELREAKATSDERGKAKDRQINDLNEQLSRLQVAKNALTEKLNVAEAQLCEHTCGSSSEDFESIKQELEEARSKLVTADETEAAFKKELETLRESIQAKESQINTITQQKIEAERKASSSCVACNDDN